jgi:hypothetical protein
MATHEDAALAVQLMQWGTQAGLDRAVTTVFDDAFNPEEASASDTAVQTILTMGETIGTLVKHNVLDREFITDLIWVDGIWSRVAPAAIRAREKFGEPRLYENFEALATG